jgi:fatty-acyl-CoA synthase
LAPLRADDKINGRERVSDPVHSSPTVGAQSLRTLARYPDRTAFSWPGGSITYRGAIEQIGRMQRVLTNAGVSPGARMALLSANRADAWCVGVAAQASRMATTWLHPLASVDDQVDQIEDSEAQILVIDTDTFLQRGGELAARAAGVRRVFTLGRAEYGVDIVSAIEAVGSATAKDLAGPDDVAALNYTGGTTGKSKGALRRHRELAGFASAVLSSFEIPDNPRFLAVAPISHVAGTKVLPTLMRGGTVRLLKRFDPEAVLAAIARERINFTLLVPTMIYVLLDHPSLSATDTSSLELLLYGASPISPSRLFEGLERIGPVFSQLYGQTECYPISVLRKADHDRNAPELALSCGFPVGACEVKILDDAGNEVAVGEPGEICVRSPYAMAEYWKRPEQTLSALRHGWLHTDDIARADDRGYLFILDRKKDMIISGGFNVYPREVEDALATHPGVAIAAVMGAPDEKWGEVVTAFVVTRGDAAPTAQELIDYVKKRKGSAQAPKHVKFVPDLPLTAVGKIDKKKLRASLWAGRERMVG